VGTSNCRIGKSRSTGVKWMKLYRENGSGMEISCVVFCYGYVYCRIGVDGHSPVFLKQL
jgi:hypothetical protein